MTDETTPALDLSWLRLLLRDPDYGGNLDDNENVTGLKAWEYRELLRVYEAWHGAEVHWTLPLEIGEEGRMVRMVPEDSTQAG